MRTPFGAAAALVFFVGLVSPEIAVASPTLVAQAANTQSSLSGHVTDGSGHPIARASVTLAGNGSTQTVQTDSTGGYRFSAPPGLYRLSVNAGGYQSAQTDVTIVAGAASVSDARLVDANLGNLQVIGRTSTTAQRNVFNTSSSASTSVNASVIRERDTADITQVVNELPGITVQAGSSAPNKSFTVRGADVETKVTIEGHPVSSGVFGSFFTQYAAAGIFSTIDLLKGAGLNGPTAGQSAIGTVNLRTPDFSAHDSAYASFGADSYAGGVYTFFVDKNFLKDDRLSILIGKSFSGYRGPTYGHIEPNFDFRNSPSVPLGTGIPPSISGIFSYAADFSDSYTLNAELAKLRYKFSKSTALSLEFLGLQGKFDPQGGAYGQYEALTTVAPCTNGGAAAASAAACGWTSVYNAPWVQNQIGNTIDGYTFFPGSNVKNNNPNFSAELRTTYKNDTIFLRPYTAVINRLVDGNGEPSTPGNNGGWYQVTSNANCSLTFAAPTKTTPAQGPCFPGNAPMGTVPFVNPGSTSGVVFPVQSTTPYNCSTGNPCYTTPTAINNAGSFGYGTPFNQPEVDKLAGYTFTYIHPVGANTFNLSFDHFMDETTKYQGDTTSPLPGCTLVLRGGTTNPAPGKLGYQPSCTNKYPGNVLPGTAINVPDTVVTQSDLSLTAQFQIREKLEFDFGNYFTLYKGQGQIEDPALLATYAAAGANLNAAPLQLVTRIRSFAHYDPHFGFVYRPSRDVSLRLTAGSSISVPFASQISGPGNLNLSNSGSDTYAVKNIDLKPEEVVAFDLGGDVRTPSGTIFSADAYANTVHDAWITSSFLIPNFPGRTPQLGTLQTQIINGPLKRYYGLELAATNEPLAGFGFRANATLQRAFYDQLPLSYIANGGGRGQPFFNGKQIDGIPYAKAYGEIQYATPGGGLLRFGANYEGNDNASFGPPFTIFDATLRVPIATTYAFQISGENIFNLQSGNGIARALFGQGYFSVNQTYQNGHIGYAQSSNGIVAPMFRTFRFTLSRRL